MKKKIIILALLLVSFVLLNSLLKKETDMSHLADLGGVYQSDFKSIDFETEISGSFDDGQIFPVTKTVDASGRQIRGWGISRKKNNQPPDPDPGAAQLLEKYGGIYIGDTSKKEIYLTFDEGYENGYTPKILDVLKANNVKAVFFITGPYLKEHEDLVRRMVEEGHTVGNHTIHHPSLPTLDNAKIEEEVLGLDRVFFEKFGQHMKYLRPPKGEYNERTLAITHKLGYCNLFWSFAYDDWDRNKSRGADYAYQKVMSNLHNGAVLLLHAVSKDNAEALDQIIKGARQAGYTFGSVDNLIRIVD
jgi:peptidoglycan-N-acetylmuramic acid deacetylase